MFGRTSPEALRFMLLIHVFENKFSEYDFDYYPLAAHIKRESAAVRMKVIIAPSIPRIRNQQANVWVFIWVFGFIAVNVISEVCRK